MAKPVEKALSIRQELFVTEYLKDRNGVQAALRAGYPASSAHTSAHRCLKNPIIAEKVRAATSVVVKRATVDPEFVLGELRRIAEQDDVAQSTKVRALELLAKHLGMLEDRISLKTDGLSGEQRAERVAILLERVRGRGD